MSRLTWLLCTGGLAFSLLVTGCIADYGCPEENTVCRGVCVDTRVDHENCGTCGNRCAEDEVCANGRCTAECPSGYVKCGQRCVNVMSDENHCGACFVWCPPGHDCVNGKCINQDCPSGQLLCGGYCVDPTTDENNCGACGIVCARGETCVGGVCQSADGHTVGLWHMDEEGAGTTTLFDSSGYGNHLVRSDASENVVGNPGRFGYAVGGWAHVLNIGEDRDRYFANTCLAGTSNLTELTFEFWLKLPANGVRNDPNPFGLGDDDDDRFRIADHGSLEYDNEGIQGTISTGILPFGTWNHVALTWDADYARIWLNGELAAQNRSTGLSPITFLRLGGQHHGNTNFSSGYVDEARLSDVVRYTSSFEPPRVPFNEVNRDIAFTPVEWTIDLDTHGPGIHTIFMIADVSPLGIDNLQDLGGDLIWDEAEVALCADPNDPPQQWGKFVSVREIGDGYLRIGDGFQTDFQGTGCDINSEMDSVFRQFDLPETACLWVMTGGLRHEYCAPLTVLSP